MASFLYANKTAFTSAAIADTILGNSGDDSLIFSATVALVDADFAAPRLNNARVDAATRIERLHLSDTASQVVLGSDAASFGIASVFGGNGNDTLNLSDYITSVTLSGGSGNDSISGGSGNDSIDGGIGNDSIHGGGGSDILLGGAGTDRLDGGIGMDSMVGGAGNDTYYVDNNSDAVVEVATEGTDWVIASIDGYVLPDQVERLLMDTGALTGTGNSLANSLVGNTAANSILGGTGNDTILGLDNNDTLYGEDGADSLLGGNGHDWIEGGSGNDTFDGGAGNDTIDGGDGDDSMIGGAGDDVYYINSTADRVSEVALTGGLDTILVAVNLYNMASRANEVENAILSSSIIRVTGNSINNSIVGNAENNSIDGNAGNDTMVGLSGNDYYLVDSLADLVVEVNGQGTDSVQSSINNYTLGDHVEYLLLIENPTVISGSGNSLDNSIIGNSFNNSISAFDGNDTLSGGAGDDTLIGGLGNDYFILDSSLDIIIESFGEGMDTVESSATHTLAGNCEIVTLSGLGFISAFGNALANTLYGNIRNNSLDGGAGIDSMVGGVGNDTYFVENAGDSIYEISGEGTDWVITTLAAYTLAGNVERLLLDTGAISGTGNSLANSLVGNGSTNSLIGGDGNDTILGLDGTDSLYGEDGTDSLLGGNGDDWIEGGSGNDTFDGGAGNDTMDGGDGDDSMVGGDGDDVYYINSIVDRVSEVALTGGSDTILVAVNLYNMASRANEVENAILSSSIIRITGNSINNSIVGNTENNSIDGNAGNDTMVGLTGNDYYFVDSTLDLVVESSGAGTDSIRSSIDNYILPNNLECLILVDDPSIFTGTGNSSDNLLLGNSLNNTLSGLDGNDTLDGGTGSDSLIGGNGNDYYIADSSSDIIVEGLGAGTDTIESGVTCTLLGNIEVLTLSGNSVIHAYGNSLNNSIFGNSRSNTIDGGSGADTMIGGNGNEYYIVDNANDFIIEDLGPSTGIDSVYVSISGYSLAQNVEHLILGPNAQIASGNSLNNTLTGNSKWNSLFGADGNDWLAGIDGRNTLNGGAGADTMVGGSGNDFFVKDDINDSLVGNGGSDGIILDSITFEGYVLDANFHSLVLGKASGIFSGTGNNGNNSLIGNSLANTLDGSSGTDTLIGDAGNDYYIINSSEDVIIELDGKGTDSIEFSGLASYTLSNFLERLVLGAGAINGTGNSANNTLTGNASNNSLFGGTGTNSITGNDSLFGGNGDDTLAGANKSVRNEIDTLTGGSGADVFILGNSSAIFYDDGYSSQYGITDYALITDFDSTDRIILKSGTYYFTTVSGGAQDLYLDTNFYRDEMIARFQGTNFATTSFSASNPLGSLNATFV
jgi:Ca2+-binding RTX toxin-like protein